MDRATVCQQLGVFHALRAAGECSTAWGERRGSNPRQPVPQTGALPTELRPPPGVREISQATLRRQHSRMLPPRGVRPITGGKYRDPRGKRLADETLGQVPPAIPPCDGGAGTGAAPVLLLRDGAGRGRHQPAIRGGGHLLERGGALQHRAVPPGAVGQARRAGGGWHAARVHHHHGDGRDRDGAPGHEVLPGVARVHRELGRADGARACL